MFQSSNERKQFRSNRRSEVPQLTVTDKQSRQPTLNEVTQAGTQFANGGSSRPQQLFKLADRLSRNESPEFWCGTIASLVNKEEENILLAALIEQNERHDNPIMLRNIVNILNHHLNIPPQTTIQFFGLLQEDSTQRADEAVRQLFFETLSKWQHDNSIHDALIFSWLGKTKLADDFFLHSAKRCDERSLKLAHLKLSAPIEVMRQALSAAESFDELYLLKAIIHSNAADYNEDIARHADVLIDRILEEQSAPFQARSEGEMDVDEKEFEPPQEYEVSSIQLASLSSEMLAIHDDLENDRHSEGENNFFEDGPEMETHTEFLQRLISERIFRSYMSKYELISLDFVENRILPVIDDEMLEQSEEEVQRLLELEMKNQGFEALNIPPFCEFSPRALNSLEANLPATGSVSQYNLARVAVWLFHHCEASDLFRLRNDNWNRPERIIALAFLQCSRLNKALVVDLILSVDPAIIGPNSKRPPISPRGIVMSLKAWEADCCEWLDSSSSPLVPAIRLALKNIKEKRRLSHRQQTEPPMVIKKEYFQVGSFFYSIAVSVYVNFILSRKLSHDECVQRVHCGIFDRIFIEPHGVIVEAFAKDLKIIVKGSKNYTKPSVESTLRSDTMSDSMDIDSANASAGSRGKYDIRAEQSRMSDRGKQIRKRITTTVLRGKKTSKIVPLESDMSNITTLTEGALNRAVGRIVPRPRIAKHEPKPKVSMLMGLSNKRKEGRMYVGGQRVRKNKW